ncbi:cystathionine beta-lyase [Paraburkholderia kururiensis]|uniref:cystathionine beta-lyase n=1 Tax=Paraburkholderia kururiensis TaxID=984307 RepID=UPI0005AA6085|nr:cystathionine beta-lyase [Paraburkholderia kururiensis]
MAVHASKSSVQTRLVHGGRNPACFSGMVNTPVHRGSTVVAASLAEWDSRKEPGNPTASYGRFGTPTTRSFEQVVADLEGGYRSIVFPSGLSACALSLLAFVRSGDHVLMSDAVYGPTRQFAENVLTRFGVQTTFFDPLAGAGIRADFRPNTRVVFVESPSSWTFEVLDIPAIAEVAKSAGATVIMDNTWASPLYFNALGHGVDVSIQAATKYIVGHSDALLGVATATEAAWPALAKGAHDCGQTAGPDDLYLALRGIRTLDVRLRQHWANGVKLAQSLVGHPLIERVMHPALPDDPGHKLWTRDFTGASGLFGVALKPMPRAALAALMDSFRLFGIGLSWGGFESLALLSEPVLRRSVRPWPHRGHVLRIHAGLENVDDLIADMREALRNAQAQL